MKIDDYYIIILDLIDNFLDFGKFDLNFAVGFDIFISLWTPAGHLKTICINSIDI